MNKYYIIEAETLEARQHHRQLVELALKNSNLSDELRSNLEWELKQALIQESDAEEALEKKEKEKKEGDGENGGDQQGDSGKTGGEDDEDRTGGEGEGEGGFSNLEMFALLLFLVEQDIAQRHLFDTEILNEKSDKPLAAATLLFNKEEQIAHIHEPYMPECEGNMPSEFLPSLEHHAMNIGARVMHLKVHPDAVDFFRKKLGYQPCGTFRQGDLVMQRMRKTLIRISKIQGSDCA